MVVQVLRKKMDELKKLYNENHAYMAENSTFAWSRHVFDNNCKPNTLFNNMVSPLIMC